MRKEELLKLAILLEQTEGFGTGRLDIEIARLAIAAGIEPGGLHLNANGAIVCPESMTTGIPALGDAFKLNHIQAFSLFCEECYPEKTTPKKVAEKIRSLVEQR